MFSLHAVRLFVQGEKALNGLSEAETKSISDRKQIYAHRELPVQQEKGFIPLHRHKKRFKELLNTSSCIGLFANVGLFFW